jgi:hypothetical protein
MTRTPLLLLLALAGWTLWLALDGRETAVRLVEGRPPPF